MMLSKLNIPFNIVIQDANLILVDVKEYYEYQNGKKTDVMLGYKYLVVEDKNFEKFAVKIPSTTPAITKEQIDAAKERIRVNFTDAVAKPYRTNSGDYDLSISATGISIVK